MSPSREIVPAFDVAQLLQPLTEGGKVRVTGAQEQNTKPGDLSSWLRLGGQRRNKGADSESKNEPDPPRGHLCGGGWGKSSRCAATV